MASPPDPAVSVDVTESLNVPTGPLPAGQADGNGRAMVRVTVNLKLLGVDIKTQAAVPRGPASLRQLLPVLRGFSQAMMHTAVKTSEAAGRQISCKSGCGACCRQLVPITQPEAYMLADLVAAMPEPRRGEILGRFSAAREKLKAAGLLDRVASMPPSGSGKSLGLNYFAQKVPCPFLENESCSIYADRPLVCREYLVTNDPKFCANPDGKTIRTVMMLGAMSAATRKAQASGQRVALVLALEWAAQHPDAPPTRTGPQLLREVLASLTGTQGELGGESIGEQTGVMGSGAGDATEAPH